ncbi:hypothetical protein LR48_Vigan07g041700 [Vigna angularis]|uniref:NDR1/HIN1-like protein n=2 Tax=Phaseolus angularis TaxID=3914 RepID=A0A0L9UVC0_PHAAN|nr:NDR1/HIN1-like protein 13 [Vigna angularis]KAG2391040.1 NDR1/HIN1-like protein [Vigna angularis]KOM46713.1 hypothetical protein LR48_Vigan07g041700 [Vigna angularis]BAT80927.1 hypothetical protein VIGAN_03055600 [Vigna angularis var. angularis]
MADRVHPRDSPPLSAESQSASPQDSSVVPQALRPPPSEKPVPSPGTYVIKIPKDQVYRVPPAENARRYDQYTHRKHRRSRCCSCCCWLIGILSILIVLLGIAAGIFYLVFRPKAPKYTIEDIAIRGINVTSPSSDVAISPEFNVTVKADNPNDKIGIYYLKDSSAEVFYNDARLCNGALPAFHQPSNNVTVFGMVLKGNGIELRSEDRKSLVESQTKRKVPLTVRIRAPVKIKVGSVKTWKITVKLDCDVTVNDLTAQAKIVSKRCDYEVDLW